MGQNMRKEQKLHFMSENALTLKRLGGQSSWGLSKNVFSGDRLKPVFSGDRLNFNIIISILSNNFISSMSNNQW